MGKGGQSPEYEYSQVPTKIITSEKQEPPLHYGFGVRHIQTLLCFLCIVVSLMVRGHMGVTVVSMTSPFKGHRGVLDANVTVNTNVQNYTHFQDITEGNMTIEAAALVNSTDRFDGQTFDWPKSIQEMVLGSFFLGYCIMTFPMGMAAQRWGGKIPLQISLFVNGIASILTPLLTNWAGWKGVCACRIAQGLSQAGVFPSTQNLLAKWIPVNKRGTFTSYVYTGTTLGTVIAFQLSGFLSESKWGWPSTFYAVGIICLVLFAFLTIFGAASPAEHKFISEEEKNYIMGGLGDEPVKKLKIPWKAIMKSKHMWGTMATHIGCGISFVFFFTQVPSYIHYILGVNIRSSGLLSSLPYMVSFFTSLSFGMLSDYLTNKKYLSISNARRVFNSISQVTVAVALVLVTFTTSTTVAVACLICSMGCHVAMHVGWMVNHIDLSPNFSGTLMMIGNCILNVLCVLLPVLNSNIVTDVTNQTQWRTLFCIIAAVAVTANTIFVIFMTGETQPWNDGDQSEECIENADSKNEKEKPDNKLNYD